MALTLHYARLVFDHPQPIYELHRDLCTVLGKRDAEGYLFRTDVDRASQPARRVVLVQTKEQGAWSKLRRAPASVETRERTWDFAAGQRLRFFLRANATRAKKASLRELSDVRGEAFRSARGKRVALRGDGPLEAWLRHWGTARGFRIHETPFTDETGQRALVPALRISVARDEHWTKGPRHGHHAGTDFEGLLEVTDAALIERALVEGIGAAKAFGFGLLSLAPAP